MIWSGWNPAVAVITSYSIHYTKLYELANGRTDDEIAREIGADAVIYQDLPDLIAAVKAVNPHLKQFDASCFDGKYITGDVSEAYLNRLEGQRNNFV